MDRIRHSILPIALIAGIVAGVGRAEAQPPCIRCDDPDMAALVARGLERSATFRRLHERLTQSNLIVHVGRHQGPKPGSGFNQFVVHAGSYRFVRISLNVAHVSDESVALLGHELQHAVELAQEPGVDDREEYEQLYQRIGYLSCRRSPRCFDTAAAVRAGREILRELRRSRARPGPAVAPFAVRHADGAEGTGPGD